MNFTGDINSDCCILESYLDQIEFYAGTERRTGQFKEVKIPKGCGSMLYGVTWKSYLKKDDNGDNVYRTKDEESGLYFTKVRDLYPELDEIFKEFGSYHFPEFKFEQVQLNKNYKCTRHIDSSNIGESILLTLGDFEGGKTIIEKEGEEIVADSHNSPYKFNGSKYYHRTTDFTGKRYALVFFTNRKIKKTQI